MAIHHSATGGIGMQAEQRSGGVINGSADFTNQSLAIFSSEVERRANGRQYGAGADWFRHMRILLTTLSLWLKSSNPSTLLPVKS